MRKLKVGSDFSGVGAFDQALIRLGIDYETVFACDMDKHARKTFIANYGNENDVLLSIIDGLGKTTISPKDYSFYFPKNVYEREIPKDSLDIYMTSPPCQAFSLAGKRKGKEDLRGILFFNSHEFIIKNKPRFFIFENVKGLLSDDNGNTFQEWINYLGGKSVNGIPVIFPTDDAAPYHIYWKVINAKHHNIPQNRERVFIVGIRDDVDNVFSWPNEVPLTRKLKDVLESDVPDKYFLSEKMVSYLTNRSDNFNNGKINFKDENSVASTLTKSSGSIDISDNIIVVGNTNPCGHGQNGNIYDENGISPTLSTNKGEGIKIKSATSKGYEEATENDSINYTHPNSKTRRGRVGVGVGVAQTLDTNCQQGVLQKVYEITCDCGHVFIGTLSDKCPKCKEIKSGSTNEIQSTFEFIADYRSDEGLRIRKDNISPCMTSSMRDTDEFKPNAGTRNPPLVGFSQCTPVLTPDRLEKRQNGRRFKEDGEEMFTITTQDRHGVFDGFKIRRLTPVECFRLMDFPDSLVENARSFGMSDSQLYKQAGNSICVGVLEGIIKGLKKL
jgi:DNA (cytosine-5)-methyltransferase 1